jgi:dihydrolipoamide dehydrogenase
MAKMMYRKDSGDILGVHMIGLHSADNIHEFSNAMNMGLNLRQLKFNVHAHPTVAEVNEELIRHAQLDPAGGAKPAAAAKQAVAA